MTQISPKSNPDNSYTSPGSNTPEKQSFKIEDENHESSISGQNTKRLKQTNLSLRDQLLWVVLPTVLIPLAIACYSGYRAIHKSAEDRIKRQLQDQALLSGKATGELLNNALELPTIVATNPLIIDAARNAVQQVEESQLNSLPVEEVEGMFATTKLLQPNKILNDYLNRAARTGGAAELFFTERYGFNVGSSNPTSDIVQKDEDWWQRGKNQKQWISSPAYDQSSNTFSIDLVQAITDPNTEEFLGVIKSALPSREFERLAQYLENTGISGSQQLQIIDSQTSGVITTVTAQGPSNTRDIVGREGIVKIAKSIVEKLEAGGINPDVVSQELKTEYGLKEVIIEPFVYESGEKALTVSLVDEDKRYTIATVPKTNGWVTIASIDNAEIASAGSELIRVFLAIAVILALIAFIVVRRLAHQLSIPLVNLAGRAEQIASGNLDVLTEPKGTKETQTLGESFNNLVIQVKILLERQAGEARLANLLAQISRAHTQHELESCLTSLLQEARKVIQTERTLVYKFDENWQGKIIAESVASGWPRSLGVEIEDPCFMEKYVEKYQQGGIRAFENIYTAGLTECHLKQLEPFAVKASLVIPIIIGDKLFGLLVNHQCSGPRVWQQDEIDYLAQLSNQMGIAISAYSLLEQKQAEAEKERERNEVLQRELFQLLSDVEEASRGDLTVRAEISASEIGIVADFFNAIIESLREIVTQVKQAATQVNSSIGENESAIRHLAEEALKQATQITQTLNSVEEMTFSIQEVASNAKTAAEVARKASTTAQTGGEAMERTVESILRMQKTISDTSRKVKRLGESSQQISKVISLINQISLKTKVLAVNAGIEAGRAGEDAQGFVVVAEEVGKLAAQSATATKEVEQIIEKIQLETVEVIQAMEIGTNQVMEGTRLVEKTKESLEEIVDVSRQIDRLVQSISNSTVSQVHASEAVTNLMQEIAKVSQQTSDSSRQVSSALRETVEIAKQLQESVSTFRVEEQT